MHKFLYFLCFLQSTACFCQSTIEEHLAKEFLPEVDIQNYPPFTFEWNFSGKMQTFVNDGLTNLDEGKYTRAIAAFNTALLQDSSFVPALYYRGVCKKLIGEFKEAEKDLLDAAKFAPSSAEILLELGEVFHLTQQLLKASDAYNKPQKSIRNLRRLIII